MTVASAGATPWTRRAGRCCVGLVLTGVGTIAVAWQQASGTARQGHQVPWLSVGIIGVTVIGAASLVWLLSGRHAIVSRRDGLLDALERHPRLVRPAPDAPTGPGSALVAVAGSSRYHAAGCLLVQGKAVRSASRAAHEAGRRPCEMCRP